MDSEVSGDEGSHSPEATSSHVPFVPCTPKAEIGSHTQPNTDASMSSAVFDAMLSLNRLQTLRPLDNQMEDFLNPSWLQVNQFFVPPQIGLVSAVVIPKDASCEMPQSKPWSDFAIKRIRHTNLVKTDDQVKWGALRKLKTLILVDPQASKVGRSLVSGVKLLSAESEWEASFADAFQGKSVATLAKRSGALWRFNEWLMQNNLPVILHVTESVIYRYMEHLKEHGAPSTATSFIQALTFLHHCIGMLTFSLEELLSSRVRGAARSCLELKKPLRQSAPLSVKMVVALENVVTVAPYDHWKIIAGHLLMCLGSSSRFGDSIHLASLKISNHQDMQLIEGESKSFKTAQTEERRRKLLPILSLGRFFAKQPWAQDWMDLRVQHGLTLDPALPAFSEMTQQWLPRRMTTGEAALYLKEFLTSSGFSALEVDLIGCHSLKATLLSWAAKGNYLSVPDRLLMGHHMTRDNQSAVAYARDELTRIMTVVYTMCQDVKKKSFKPDANRAERLFDAVVGMPESDDVDQDDSDASADEIEPMPIPKGNRQVWDDLPLEFVSRLRIHAFSGVVHVAREDDARKFLCGRANSRNFDEIPMGSNYFDLPVCLQCRSTYG